MGVVSWVRVVLPGGVSTSVWGDGHAVCLRKRGLPEPSGPCERSREGWVTAQCSECQARC